MKGTLKALAAIAVMVVCTAPASEASAIRLDAGFGTTTLPANDDGSTGEIAAPFALNFFGETYTSFWVNNNGNITFDGPLAVFTPSPLNSVGLPVIAPFFADVDTSDAGDEVTYGTSTVEGFAAFGVNWLNVDYFDSSVTHTNRNSFQLVLIDRSDTGAGNFDIEFNYGLMLWEAGQASGGGADGRSPPFAPPGTVSCARAGFSDVSTAPFELPGSAVCGDFLAILSEGSINSDVTGRFLFHARNGEFVSDEVEEPAPVPEPGTLMLLGSGVVGAIVARRRALKR